MLDDIGTKSNSTEATSTDPSPPTDITEVMSINIDPEPINISLQKRTTKPVTRQNPLNLVPPLTNFLHIVKFSITLRLVRLNP
jgi:hypothetical protein